MWLRSNLLCLGLLWAGAAFAQQTTAGTLQGTVVNDITGAPVPGASVMVSPVGQSEGSGSYRASTDGSGGFTITNVAPGSYRVSAQKNRYVRAIYGQSRPGGQGRTVSIIGGERPERIEIRMTPAAVVTGRVIDENGEPVPYVRISMMSYRYLQGERSLVASGGSATTNDLGEYRAFGIDPGRYYVSAQTRSVIRGRRGAAEEEDTVYPVLYYPGTFDVVSASPIELRAGEERSGVDFRLARSTAVTVSGVAVSADGSALDRRTSVMLIPRESSTRMLGGRGGGGGGARFDSRTGEFEISGVLPGAYILIGMTRTRDNQLAGRLAVDVGPDDVQGLRIVLSPGQTVAGRLELPENPPEGLDTGRLRIFLRSEMISAGRSNGTMNEDGTFRLENVALGTYQVEIGSLPEDAYVAAVRLGSRELPDMTLDVLEGGVMDLVIPIHAPGGTLAGRTLDEDSQPQSEATVALVPKDPTRTDLYKRTRSDESGSFSLRGIAPGKYTLYAFDDIEQGAEMDPDFLASFENDGEEIEIEEPSTETLDLTVITAASGRS